jgi:uncharacterized protein (DUF779 family)
MQVNRIVLTPSAREALRAVAGTRTEKLSLVIGNGCCDSTAPFLFADYLAGPNERLVDRVGDVDILVDQSLEPSFSASEFVVDAVRDGASADSFSCEAELGYRFHLKRMPLL